MVKLNMKGKPLFLMVNGELFGVEEVSRKLDAAKFLTIKAINVTGQRKLTIQLDFRLIDALKEEKRDLYYIH